MADDRLADMARIARALDQDVQAAQTMEAAEIHRSIEDAAREVAALEWAGAEVAELRRARDGLADRVRRMADDLEQARAVVATLWAVHRHVAETHGPDAMIEPDVVAAVLDGRLVLDVETGQVGPPPARPELRVVRETSPDRRVDRPGLPEEDEA